MINLDYDNRVIADCQPFSDFLIHCEDCYESTETLLIVKTTEIFHIIRFL